MSQPTLSDFIVTPASNTDIGGIGVLGTSLVSTADDAFRTLQALLKSGVQTGYTTVATAAGTTTLTANSNSYQYATGVLAQTYAMPVTSTLELGRTFTFVNNSTGALTINSSGGNLITTVPAGTSIETVCILTSGTTAASWSAINYSPWAGAGGDKGNPVTLTYTYSDDTATVGPSIVAYRKSGTPAANDFLAYYSGSADTLRPSTNADMGGVAFKLTDPGVAGGSPNDGSSSLILRSRHLAGSVSSIVDSLVLAGSSTATFLGAITVSNGGTSSIGGLLSLTGAAAGQIAFPASQHASADANTLDDYEEGTGTPGMTFNASATGVTYGLQTETYTKIGNRVFYDISLTLTSNGSGVGTALVTGLVFTSAAGEQFAATYLPVTGFSGLTAGVNGEVSASATTITVRFPTTTGSTTATDTNVTDTAAFRVSGHYGT